MELTPSYGRDYKSAKDVKAAFDAGKDFAGDYSVGFQTINREQIRPGTTVLLRYKRNTAVVAHKVTAVGPVAV